MLPSLCILDHRWADGPPLPDLRQQNLQHDDDGTEERALAEKKRGEVKILLQTGESRRVGGLWPKWTSEGGGRQSDGRSATCC